MRVRVSPGASVLIAPKHRYGADNLDTSDLRVKENELAQGTIFKNPAECDSVDGGTATPFGGCLPS